MLTLEQKKQFNDILEELGGALDISQTEYDAAVKSYNAVGQQLAKENSILRQYDPEILPQGSFMIGTMIKPVNPNDDLDIDLVCQLNGKNLNWTQKELKNKVGFQIADNDIFKPLLENPDGRRCWTMRYRENSKNSERKYHMDILPCVTGANYKEIFEKAFSNNDLEDLDSLAIRITDKESQYYDSSYQYLWLKSNPFGYAKWFFNRASVSDIISKSILEASIQAVPKMQKNKLPLQTVVQILKRHRDLMFSDESHSDDKPISIIITTLAAKAYNKESNVISALSNIVASMGNFIIDKYDENVNRVIKWVGNPINNEENFADKWVEYPKRQDNFFKWLEQVKKDLDVAFKQRGGLHLVQESLEKPFGKAVVQKAFKNYGQKLLLDRENGDLGIHKHTGEISKSGKLIIQPHKFFGL
ncbi:nucleotidyltransferase [marine bacterium AO1-C]|nr:nucleotidyltransferase [marine bacterium AO1-C]